MWSRRRGSPELLLPDDDGTYDLSYNDKDDVILHLIRDHTHCACAHKAKYAKDIGNHTEHVDHEFVAWTDKLVKEQYGSDTTLTAATALPKVAGCYYLTGDVTPAKAWWAADGTIICMNGHKIVSAGAIGSTVRVDSDVHVVLTDCRASGSISAIRATGAAGLGFASGVQTASPTFSAFPSPAPAAASHATQAIPSTCITAPFPEPRAPSTTPVR